VSCCACTPDVLRVVRSGSFATESCQQQVQPCPLCTESDCRPENAIRRYGPNADIRSASGRTVKYVTDPECEA
jgi:hypothetical protein